MYDFKFTDAAIVNIKALPKSIRNALKRELQQKVAVNPRACAEPLTGFLEGWYSFHYLEYRVIYKVYDDLFAVGIAGVGKHNKDATMDIYRKLEALAKTGRLAQSVLTNLRGLSLVLRPPS